MLLSISCCFSAADRSGDQVGDELLDYFDVVSGAGRGQLTQPVRSKTAGKWKSSMWFNGSYTAPLRVVLGGIRACTHLAQVSVDGHLVTAYVKTFAAGNDRLLFSEVVGGWLARASGIGVPAGGLLWVPESALQAVFPGIAFPAINGMVASYACAPVGNGYGVTALGLYDTVAQSVAEDQLSDVVLQHLLKWPGFAACVAFDEWVANVDRHLNNLLLAGQLH